MKIQFALLAALLVVGTELLSRAAVQGIDQALLSTVIDYGISGIKAAKRVLANIPRSASSTGVDYQ